MLRDPVLGPLISVVIIVLGVEMATMMHSTAAVVMAWVQIVLGCARLALQFWWIIRGHYRSAERRLR